MNDKAAHDNSLSLTIVNMENDNSQSPKDPKKNILSGVAEPISSFFNLQRPASPSSSKKSKGHSSKRLIGKLLSSFTTTSPSQSTSSLPLTSLTENPSGEAPLGKYRISSMYTLNCNPIVDSSTAIASDGMPPTRPSLMMDSSRYPDHRTSIAPTESHALATSPAVQGERPYNSAPLVRLIVVHRSCRSSTSSGSNSDRLYWSVSW